MKSITDSKACNDQEYISRIISLCDNSSNRLYRKNEVLFCQNSEPVGVYYIKTGKARIVKTGPNGKRQIVRFVSGGDIIGIKSAIADKRHSVSAEAIDETMVCVIPKENFLELLFSTPDLAYYLIDCLSRCLQEVENRSISINQKTERERLAEALLEVSRKFHSDEIHLLKKDLLEFTSIGKEQLRSCLDSFRARKLIALNSERIKILDICGLTQQAGIPA